MATGGNPSSLTNINSYVNYLVSANYNAAVPAPLGHLEAMMASSADASFGSELDKLTCGFCSSSSGAGSAQPFANKNELKTHIFKFHADLFSTSKHSSSSGHHNKSAHMQHSKPIAPRLAKRDASLASYSASSSSSSTSSTSSSASSAPLATPAAATTATSSPAMDSFCAICQKEVCNK